MASGGSEGEGKTAIERFAKPMSAKPISSQEGFASDLERLRTASEREGLAGPSKSRRIFGRSADAEWPKAPFSNHSIVKHDKAVGAAAVVVVAKHTNDAHHGRLVFAFLLALLLVFSFANLIITSGINSDIVSNKSGAAGGGPETSVGKASTPVKVVTITDDLGCADCFDPGLLEDALKKAGMAVSESQTYSYSGPKGAELLAKYNITKVPAIILSKEFGDYEQLASSWPQLGSVEPDGAYVLRKIQPPYLDLRAGRVVGRVGLVELVDASCTECYDVSIHRSVTPRFGIANFTSIDRYDVSSAKGAELLAKYNITKVPAILLSPEASAYELLGQVWQQVGSVEKDGGYVFRAAEAMGAYKDLSSGKVVSPAAAK